MADELNLNNRQHIVHLHTTGSAAPSEALLLEGEIAVSSNVDGAAIYTLQQTESGDVKVVKFATEEAIDDKIEVLSGSVEGSFVAIGLLSAATMALERAQKSMTLDAKSESDMFSVSVETNESGTTLYFDTTSAFTDTVEYIVENAVIGISSGETQSAGVIVTEDNELDFSNLRVDGGAF